MKRSLATESLGEKKKLKPSSTSPCKAGSSQSTAPSTEEKENILADKSVVAAIEKQCSATPILDRNIGHSWFKALKPEFDKPYFKKLSSFVVAARLSSTVYPPPKDVFSWTRYCPVDGVKVVILGQDPYHGPQQAHGLCFSVQPGITPPPSLKNMYKELESDIPGFKSPGHGYLVDWAEQGVLMLNAVLTVKSHNANSHKGQGWEDFTAAVLRIVAEHNKGVVFLLWGLPAQKMINHIKKDDHHLLKTAHPSPLSARRGFFGCKHFSQCNELLEKQGKDPIDWTKLSI